MAQTSIEWADRSWNPVVGCSIVSPGCTNCYAMAIDAALAAIEIGGWTAAIRELRKLAT